MVKILNGYLYKETNNLRIPCITNKLPSEWLVRHRAKYASLYNTEASNPGFYLVERKARSYALVTLPLIVEKAHGRCIFPRKIGVP